MNGKFMGYIPVIAALALTSCTPTRVDPAVPLPSVTDWQNGQDAAAISSQAALASWWRGFRDPVLDKLIAEAMTANQDLRIAKARVQEAQQIVTVTESALYPSVDFNAEGGRDRKPSTGFSG
jgi:outer membrane protein TolC